MVMGPSNNNSPTSKSILDLKMPDFTHLAMQANPVGSQGGLGGNGEGSSRSQEAVGQGGSGRNEETSSQPIEDIGDNGNIPLARFF